MSQFAYKFIPPIGDPKTTTNLEESISQIFKENINLTIGKNLELLNKSIGSIGRIQIFQNFKFCSADELIDCPFDEDEEYIFKFIPSDIKTRKINDKSVAPGTQMVSVNVLKSLIFDPNNPLQKFLENKNKFYEFLTENQLENDPIAIAIFGHPDSLNSLGEEKRIKNFQKDKPKYMQLIVEFVNKIKGPTSTTENRPTTNNGNGIDHASFMAAFNNVIQNMNTNRTVNPPQVPPNSAATLPQQQTNTSTDDNGNNVESITEEEKKNLRFMNELGLNDNEMNLKVLRENNGDVNDAVAILMIDD
ncbi:hypothetical protein SNEBB_002088 [Seison nebaliae]|nr:hypothetical protein SNEBB_002088 [Seison nebaliae]